MENLNLKSGEMMLVSAKGVNGGKVQLTFAQVVETGANPTNVISLLNASDDRFAQQRPSFAWISGEPVDIQTQFGIDVSGLAVGDVLEIGMLNPSINGNPLNIVITETTEGNEWEVANFEKCAKRAGKDGDYILKDGMYIYRRTSLKLGAVSKDDHKIFTDTTRQSTVSGASAIADALGA
jgi:hypothetical protein